MPIRTPLQGLALAFCLGASACTDAANPVGRDNPAPGTPPGDGISLGELRCNADLQDMSVTCGPATQTDASTDIVYGGQNELVTLTSSNVDYSEGTGAFTFDVRVRNLIPQAIGTTDGAAADPGGVKVFFVTEPTATSGSGDIEITNEDGTGIFTAANQPYFRYVEVLDQFEQSSAKPWQFAIPPSVTSFAFSVLIAAPVQYPTGWIEVSHPSYSLRRTYEKRVTGVVRNQFGREIPDAVITWSSANPALAVVDPDSGVVHGMFPGTVGIIASSTNYVYQSPGATQTGAATFTIMGNQLVWTAGAGNTDWNDPANWDRGVAPSPSDTVTVPVVGTGFYPSLVENEGVERLTIQDGATVSINAFDLTANGDVATGTTGGISNTTGRLVLTGTARTLRGVMPRMQVTGSYTLDANVTGRAPLRVQGGRLRSTGFRIRVTSE